MLLARIWGDSAYRDPRTIDVHIRHLREKVERDPKDPEYLFTVRGVGYRFRDTELGSRLPVRLSLRNRLALRVLRRSRSSRSRRCTCTSRPGCRRGCSTRQLTSWPPTAQTLLGPDRRARSAARRRCRRSTPRSTPPALASGVRVTLLLVTKTSPGGPQLSPQADSSKLGGQRAAAVPRGRSGGARGRPAAPAPRRRGRHGRRGGACRSATAAGSARSSCSPTAVSDIVRSVAMVRHEILVAGGIALLLALLGGYL